MRVNIRMDCLRHGKNSYVSQFFCIYFIDKKPNENLSGKLSTFVLIFIVTRKNWQSEFTAYTSVLNQVIWSA